MKVYCVELEGQGDKEIKLVSKEIFDWINSRDLGRPVGSDKSGWIDQTAPQEVKEYAKSNGDEVYITIGSYNNDRCFFAPPLWIDNIEAEFSSIMGLVDFCKKHDCDIEDTFEGCIY